MKKFFAILLASALCLSLAACNGTSTQTDTSKAAGTTAAGTAAADTTAAGTAAGTTAAAGDNTLTVWCWDPAFNIYAMNEAAKVYQQTNPDFKLNVVETPWADIQTALPSPDLPVITARFPISFFARTTPSRRMSSHSPANSRILPAPELLLTSSAPLKLRILWLTARITVFRLTTALLSAA